VFVTNEQYDSLKQRIKKNYKRLNITIVTKNKQYSIIIQKYNYLESAEITIILFPVKQFHFPLYERISP